MDKQTVDFYIQVQDGLVQRIGRSVINTPNIVLKKENSGIKWYEDKIGLNGNRKPESKPN